MRDTPYYRDCIWEQFSKKEYERRYAALRAKMREHKLDAIIVPGGPSHWSFGGAHALAHRPLGVARAVLLRAGAARWRADLIYSMGGTHAEAVRRQVEVAVKDVRHSRNGHYADSDGGAAARAEARARPHRPDGDRPAPRRLHAGQPVQHAAQRICRTPSSSSPRASCTTCVVDPLARRSSTACARPASFARTR